MSTDALAETREALLREFRSRSYLRSEFPMLAAWGVPDYGQTIHSLGLNYLAALGRTMGFWAVSEYPVLPSSNLKLARTVRCDILWLRRPSGEPLLLGEFERYESVSAKRRSLERKAENLVIASHHLAPAPRLLLLALWTTVGSPTRGIEALRDHLSAAFPDEDGNMVPPLASGSHLLTCTFVLRASGAGWCLSEVLV